MAEPIGDFLARHRFRRGLPRLVLAADAGLHLVLPHRPDAALPGGDDDPLLPQPRPDPGQRPSAVAHRGRRLARVRAEDAGAHPRRAAAHAGARGAARGRRRDHRHRRRQRTLRRGGAGLPQRPDPGLARRRARRRARAARRHPLPAEPRRAAHRRVGAAAAQAGLGRLELRTRGRHGARAVGGVPALPDQPAAAAAVAHAR